MIRGILFDFGNVISAFDVGRFLRRLSGWSGTEVETLRERIYGSGLHARYERGDLSSEDFHREISRLSGARIPAEEFAEAFTDIFTPLEATHGLIRWLKGRYRLGLLSNTNEWHFERHIRTVPVFPLFDTVTLSYEVRALKPSPEIYRDALRKLSLPPEECVFIDDVREYADGASALGIRGIRYTGSDDLLRSLADLWISLP